VSRRRAALVVALGLLVAGCGDDDVDPFAGQSASSVTTAPDEETSTTSLTVPPTTVAPEDVPQPAPPGDLGDDPQLDRLARECAEGRFPSCDTLFFTSPPDSDYEAYGDSCGGRNEPGDLCTTIYGRGAAAS
jgi:hypothetical protein